MKKLVCYGGLTDMTDKVNSSMFRLRYLFPLLILFCACARQGAIPNPDRFPPHLKKATSVTRTQVNLLFDERLDSKALSPNTFLITSTHDTAEIKFITTNPVVRDGGIILYTSPLQQEDYRISGLVRDGKGNSSLAEARFMASDRRDTTPPGITIRPPGNSFPYTIIIGFSESIDTTNPLIILTAPYTPKEKTEYTWDRTGTLTNLRMVSKDTTQKGSPFYVVLLPGASDFSANRDKSGAQTFIHSDTTLELRDVRGRIEASDGSSARSSLLAFRSQGKLIGMGLADSTGAFQVSLPPREEFTLNAYFDPDKDNRFEEKGSLKFPSSQDSIMLLTQPLPEPAGIEEIR
ncbi:hypothetical protein GF359_08890 [candidate division WOR-3 bacterium]|uniref:SbsA Ig-like domain-containing protein n=1 Tax=candidate division WOR-3 bacterium TaxID=2052148 RepID=A0A9D5KAV8_UNCW3|nr:hypothetical protein [candidate division WOR-3 bacterium]MBD3365315.1 hypothetical protein [candidate division WOR-3 bacterium]